ncbi:MAG: hypothetical protein A2017_10915 [Lentisphaerae bacterium GWF2_44_16]|nr:MAG: hypothetical protein A2017_10915 [Lentisphaerae bacterium GWF2_44_16]
MQDPAYCGILPKPKILNRKEGILQLAGIKEIKIPGKFRNEEDALKKLFSALNVSLKIEEGFSDNIIAGAKPQKELSTKGKKEEEYALSISPDTLEIAANSPKGLKMACRTIEQLHMLGNGDIPCIEIFDWPDIAMRGYHLDCKAGLPYLDDLYKFADRLALWKINTLLIEYEDRFPYSFAPEIRIPGSPSLEEWDAFLKHCREKDMTLIPLTQTHGHMNYVLKHEKFAGLRENGNIDEICPSNPAAVEMVRLMLHEVLSLHGPDKYFHIGADETWNLATCPACIKRLDNGESKLDIFCEHVMKMHSLLTEKSKRVMMWCDMFWRSDSPEKVNMLPRDIILCEWIYTLPTAKGSPRMAWNGKLRYTKKFCENNPSLPVTAENYIENAEPKAREFASKYLNPDLQTGTGNLSAHAEYFMEQGFDVIGVGAARSGQSDWLFGQANMIDRFNNIMNWAEYVRSKKLHGMIISSWSRGSGYRVPYSPWESALDAIAATAQYSWSPETAFKEFVRTSSINLFGNEISDKLEKIYLNMGINNEYTHNKISELEEKILRGFKHCAMLKLWNEFDMFRDEACNVLLGVEKNLSGFRHNRIFDSGRVSRKTYLSNLSSLKNNCDRWRKRFENELKDYFRAEELPEYIDSRLCNIEFRLHNLEELLTDSSKEKHV